MTDNPVPEEKDLKRIEVAGKCRHQPIEDKPKPIVFVIYAHIPTIQYVGCMNEFTEKTAMAEVP